MSRKSRKDLSRLIAASKKVSMTAEDEEKQRRSFAYGNANIENEQVTRQTVDEAAKALQAKPRDQE